MVEGLDQTEFDLVMAVFRVVFGLIFASHGWAKRFSGGGIAGTAGWFDSIGMKPGKLHANLASTTEMLTGVLLAIGLLTSFGAAGIVGVMVVAGWTVHRANGFFIVKSGWEYTFVVALIAVARAGGRSTTASASPMISTVGSAWSSPSCSASAVAWPSWPPSTGRRPPPAERRSCSARGPG
jgi:uncharacterized membrane protein YphA (DoxX/SURF4 family)